AAMGYYRAGFDIVGMDIRPQPRYPFEFVQGDALNLPVDLSQFDAVHASPPCQAYSARIGHLVTGTFPKLIEPVREKIKHLPYVIENVVGSPLINPITLCGGMFVGLRTYRHRLFESSIMLFSPTHQPHVLPSVKAGRRLKEGHFLAVAGHGYADDTRKAMQ